MNKLLILPFIIFSYLCYSQDSKDVFYYLDQKDSLKHQQIYARIRDYYLGLEFDTPDELIEIMNRDAGTIRNEEDLINHKIATSYVQFLLHEIENVTPDIFWLEKKAHYLKDLKQRAEIYMLLSDYHFQIGVSVEKEKGYMRKAIQTYALTDDSWSTNVAKINLGIICSNHNEFDSAIYYLNNALDGDFEKDYGKMHSSVLLSLAVAYSFADQMERSISIFEDLFAHNVENEVIFHCYGNVLSRGDESGWEESIRNFKKGITIAKERKNSETLRAAYHDIAKCYEQMEDFKHAHHFFLKYDSMANMVNQGKAIALLDSLEMANINTDWAHKAKELNSKIESKSTEYYVLKIALFIAIFIIGIGSFYMVTQRKKNKQLVAESIRQMSQPTSPKPKKESSGEKNIELISQMEEFLNAKKIFTDTHLTLPKFAKKLGTNTSVLSKAVNEHYGFSYSHLINHHRVEEAKRLLLAKDYSNYSIDAIAELVGYKNISSFYSNFKKITGVTPLIFQKHGSKLNQNNHSD